MSDNTPPGGSPEQPGGAGDGSNATPPAGGSPTPGPQGGTPTPPPGQTPPTGATPPPPPPPPPSTPPPPPAYSAAAGAAPVAQQANIGEALSWSFSKFGQHAKVLIIFALVPTVLGLLSYFIGESTLNFENTTQFTAGDFAGAASGLLLNIGLAILQLLAVIGLINASLKITQGITPELGDFWHPGRAITYILVSILVAIGTAVGLVLCIIPGLILIYAWQFAQFSALATDKGIVECIKESWDLVMANKVPALLAMLVYVLASLITALPLIGWIAIIFVVPIMILFRANLYRQFRGEQVAA